MRLHCTDIKKHFGSNVALDGAALKVENGTIHALLGENGAGKSTLNSIIAGELQADSGTVEVDGQRVQFSSPAEASAAGIGMVHQHFQLADGLTAAENVSLGIRDSVFGLHFSQARARQRLRDLCARTGLEVNPDAESGSMSVGERQRVEILKALARGTRLLLLDEPTAVLAPGEVATLFDMLRALREQGTTIVIVTHKLDEVYALASAVTVLRKGLTVFSGKLGDTSRDELIRVMVGDAAVSAHESTGEALGADARVILEMERVVKRDALNVEGLRIHAGEIVGVAGVEGNGQALLAGVIAGTAREGISARRLELEGADLRGRTVQQRSDAGIAYIPADRQAEGLVLEMTLAENLHLRNPPVKRRAGIPILDSDAMSRSARLQLEQYGTSPAEPAFTAGALSGGNQQKTVIARELSRKPKLIVACNPTRGLDLRSTADVQEHLWAAARKDGAAVLLISSDLDEVMTLADRVMVLYRGTLNEIGGRGVTREEVGRAMVMKHANSKR